MQNNCLHFLLPVLLFTPLLSFADRWQQAHQAEEALEVAMLRQDPRAITEAHFSLGRIYRMQLLEYACAIDHFKESIAGFLALQDSAMLGESYRNLSAVYTRTGELDQALTAAQTAINILERIPETTYLNWAYNSIGIVHKNRGDYVRALDYYNKYLAYSLTQGTPMDVAFAYNNIGTCHDELEAPEAALLAYRKALSLFQNNQHADGIGAALLNIGRIERQLGRFDEALQSFIQALNINQQQQDHHSIMVNYKNIGSLYMQKREYKKARFYYQLTAELARKLSSKKIEEGSLREISHIFLLEKNFDQAQAFIQRALAITLKDILPADFRDNPPPEAIVPDHEIIPSFEQKASILLEQYLLKTRNPKDLRAALQTCRLTIALIDRLRYDMDAKGSKLQLAANNLSAYEQALIAAQEMYKTTGDPAFMEEAFLFAEKSKATLLHERLLEYQAKRSAQIPRNLLEREAHIDRALADLQYQITGSSLHKNPTEIAELRARRFVLTQEKKALMQQMADDFPLYHRLRQQTAPASIDAIRDALNISQEQVLVEYYIGTSRSFAFRLTRKHLSMIELPPPAVLDSLVRAFRHSITDATETEFLCAASRSDSGACSQLDTLRLAAQRDYLQYAFRLYQTLIEPLEISGIEHVSQLILIPDGPLALLPFAALLTATPENADTYRNHPYLVRRYQLTYGPSASLLTRLARHPVQKAAKTPMLVVAPFTEATHQHSQLPYSRQEAEYLLRKWNGNLLLGQAASKGAFAARAPQARMLHISSHAFAGESPESKSYIAFFDQALPLHEIYSMQLQAELLMLSACETGVGPHAGGEGILSLSHAFFHAGSQSVFATLWKIPDRSSMTVMKSFYDQLEKGYPKHKALHDAQLSYLENHDHRFSHPYYWAAWTPAGSMKPVHPPNEDASYLMILGVLLSLGAGISFYFFSK